MLAPIRVTEVIPAGIWYNGGYEVPMPPDHEEEIFKKASNLLSNIFLKSMKHTTRDESEMTGITRHHTFEIMELTDIDRFKFQQKQDELLVKIRELKSIIKENQERSVFSIIVNRIKKYIHR